MIEFSLVLGRRVYDLVPLGAAGKHVHATFDAPIAFIEVHSATPLAAIATFRAVEARWV